ncbi:acidic leucine-rich nuclear phosphoprotein 32-related protein [Drosophila innubila]|uniref:acidic leucine-rich nuclear phosphoprotein 32-related protein n=1 Tax=Drosophila innubila TaxID=198719 RepID=UPI00148DF589|nr:acidic leucine-rich nuclear phosphoprotein 32-related protein [Drosophila innubila]
MKKRQRITYHAAETPKTSTFVSYLCFRVTTSNSNSTATLNVARVKRQLLTIFGLWLMICSAFVGCSAVGYSYSRFEGPVVGPERLVTVPDAYGGGTHSDYVARPEYSFAYGIEDGQTRVLQNRKETRNGDEVRGVYSVVDPDGTLRVVKYTADDANGFQAEVITNGIARLHGHGNDGDGGGAAVDEQVEHNEVNHHAADDQDDDDDDDEEQQEAPKKGKGQYKVHEDYDEGERDGGEEREEKEGGGDHEEYEGSSEEGYEDANAQQEQESSEEY